MKNISSNKKIAIKLLLVLMFTFLSAKAFCAEGITKESASDFKPYYYAGAGLGYSFVHPETKGDSAFMRISDDEDTGYRLHVGYFWRKYWSFDLLYADLGGAEVEVNSPLVIGDITYKVPAIYANYHVEQDYFDADLFTKGGLSFTQNDRTDNRIPFNKRNSVQIMTGIGVVKYIENDWGIRGDLDFFSRDAAMLSLGLQKAFRGKPQPKPQPKPEDTDGDGVIDADDKCPTTPAAYPVDAEGCTLDGDNDGVVDPLDECLTTAAGEVVDEKGCTVPTVEEALAEIDLKGINFEVNSDQLTPESKTILDAAAAVLVESQAVKLSIEAHTDSDGSAKYNLKLSDNRAKSVKSYLVNIGVAAERLGAQGFGESKPIASNDTSEGKAKNRRVEFIISDE